MPVIEEWIANRKEVNKVFRRRLLLHGTAQWKIGEMPKARTSSFIHSRSEAGV